jgi:DNA-binding NarL/FixJ family response regulator
MSIKVYLIDDHKILIDSFTDHFKDIQDIEVIGYSLSGCEAIEALNPKEIKDSPDIVLQDIDLEDMTGIECATALLKINPDLKIIGVSSYTESVIVKKLLKAGARGYISKATDIENLETAIRQVYAGENYIGDYISKSLLAEETGDKKSGRKPIIPIISDREKEVLELIAEELNTKEIGEKLFISANTVMTHRKSLLLKFDVKNSVGLVRKALEFGLLSG